MSGEIGKANVRFTAWLAEDERAGMEKLAAEHGTSINYILRIMVRAALGKSIPRWARGKEPAG